MWTFTFILLIFKEAGIPFGIVGILLISAALSCIGFVGKVVGFATLYLDFEIAAVYILIAKTVFDTAFWFILVFSFDVHFGLHFYYDLSLLNTVLSALDMVLFPNFLLCEHEKLFRKLK